MLPFCNNGWRVFVSLEGSNLTYGVMRNFNGPSVLNIDDILTTISSSQRMSLDINFVLIDVTQVKSILIKLPLTKAL